MKKKLLAAFAILSFGATVVAQTIPSYVPLNGLQAWWPFNGNGNDLSTNANNAVNNGALFVPDRFGNAGAAASFDGLSSYLQVAVPGFSLSSTGAFTYSVWVKKEVQSSSGVVLMIGSNTAGNFISNVQGMNEFQFGTNMQQSAWIWTTCPHTLYVWDHYAATYNAGIMKLYRNGTYQSTATYTYTGANTAVLPIWLGRGPGGNYYTGVSDDIGIWNRELSQAEITALYLSCDISFTTQPANQNCNLLGFARFIVASSAPSANYQWQTNQGTGFQNVTNTGQYNGANNDTLKVSNASLANNNQPFRCIITFGSCSDTSNTAILTVNNSVGIDGSTHLQSIQLFPNPASDRLHAMVPPALTGLRYSISNLLGKPVISGELDAENQWIDISDLASGVYFFRIPGYPLQTVKLVKL